MKKLTILSLAALALITGCKSEKEVVTEEAVVVFTNPMPLEEFMGAAFEGDYNTISNALVNLQDPNMTNETGQTALMLASYNGYKKVSELLLLNGAAVNLQDANGRSALMMAASLNTATDVVELLLNNDADVSLIDNVEKFTALMFAAAEGVLPSVKLLIDAGSDTSMVDKDGDSALAFAMQRDQTAVVEYLTPISPKTSAAESCETE